MTFHSVLRLRMLFLQIRKKGLKWRATFDDNFIRKNFLRKGWTRMNRLQNLMQTDWAVCNVAMAEIVNRGGGTQLSRNNKEIINDGSSLKS